MRVESSTYEGMKGRVKIERKTFWKKKKRKKHFGKRLTDETKTESHEQNVRT